MPIDTFEEGMRELRQALDTDFDYWHQASDIADGARQWHEGARDRSFLLRDKALEIAQAWLVLGASRTPSPSPAQVEFIDASRRESAREQRTFTTRLFGVISALVLLVVIAASLGVVAYHNSQVALSRQLAGESNTVRLNNRPDLAILLGLEATRTDNNADTRDSLAAALAENPHLEAILPVGKPSAAIYVTRFAYNADGTEVVAAAFDGSLMTWDVATRHRTDLVPPKPTGGTVAYIDALAVSPDGKSVAYINGDGLWLWRNIFSGASPVELKESPPVGDYNTTLALGFSSDGSKLVSVTSDCDASLCARVHVQRWNVADTGRPEDVFGLSFGASNTPKFADVAALSADANTLVVSCNDACATRQIQQWDLTTQRQVTARDTDPSRRIQTLALGRDGHSVASINCTGDDERCDKAQTWNLTQQSGPISIKTKTSMSAIAFTTDDTHLVVGECLDDPDCTSGQLQLWDVSTSPAMPLTDPFGGHINRIDALTTSPDGHHILTEQFDDNELLMWNPDEADAITREVHQTPLALPPAGSCSTIPLTYQAVYSPDGTTIAEATADSLVLLDATSLKPLTPPIKLDPVSLGYSNNGYTSDKGVYQLSFSPDGTRLAAMTQHNIFLWDFQSHTPTPAGRIFEQVTPTGGNYLYNGFSFNKDGTRLAVINNQNSANDTSNGSAIEVWNIGSGSLVRPPLQRDQYDVYGIALSPDGKTVAALYFPHGLACSPLNLADLTENYDHDVSIWDVRTGKRSADTFGGHHTAIDSLAYSPDGKILASIDYYGSAILWDATNPKAKPIATFDGFQQQQPNGFGSVGFSQDGRLLVVGSGEFLGGQPDSIAVWDVSNQQLVDRQMVTTDLAQGAEIVNAQLLPDRPHPGEAQLAWMVGQGTSGVVYTRTRDVSTWQQRACQMVNRNLTQSEWDQYGAGGAVPDTCSGTGGSPITDGTSRTTQPTATPVPMWQSLAGMPTARLGVAVVAGPDGRIYALGGNNNGYLNSVEAYTPDTNTWTALAPMPTARSALAAVAEPDGRIYAIGGQNNSGYLSTVEVYTPSTNTWTTAAPLPITRWQLAAAVGQDGRIYVFGGFNGAYLDTVEAYTPSADTWITLAPMPTARAGLAAATGPDGRIYAIGGNNSSGVLNTVEAYTPGANSWTSVAPMLGARYRLAAVTGHDGRIYALGGASDSKGNEPLASVEAYSPGANAWTAVAPMPTARWRLGAAVGPDGRIYAIGGDNKSSAHLNTVEAFG